MSAALDHVFGEAESTLTDRYQTTVPEPVRKALRLDKRCKIRYEIRSGEVVIKRADPLPEEDPVVVNFLSFLQKDMMAHPERIATLDADLMERARALVSDVEIDLDSPLGDE
jgi:antitoxin PrlF